MHKQGHSGSPLSNHGGGLPEARPIPQGSGWSGKGDGPSAAPSTRRREEVAPSSRPFPSARGGQDSRVIRGWLRGRDLRLSEGLWEAQARLGPAEREGQLGGRQKQEGDPQTGKSKGRGTEPRPEPEAGPECVGGRAGRRGGDEGAGGAPGRACSQLQLRPRASGPRGKSSSGGTRPLLVRSPSPCATPRPPGERGPAGSQPVRRCPRSYGFPAPAGGGFPGTPALLRGTRLHCRGRGCGGQETTPTGTGREASCPQLSPLESGVMTRTPRSPGVWTRCLHCSTARQQPQVRRCHPCLPPTGEETKTQRR